MAKLLLYAPCQKAVAEQASNNVSIFSVLQELQILTPSNEQVPTGAMIPMQWMTIAIWHAESETDGPFETKSVLESPSGEMIFETKTSRVTFLNQTGGRAEQHRIFENISGFPVWTPGKCWLKLLRKISEDRFDEAARWPLRIQHVTQPPST